MTLIALSLLTILLTITDAYADRNKANWGARTQYARRRGVDHEWYWNAANAWHKRWVFWSTAQKTVELLKFISLAVLLAAVVAF